ncbi:MAG: FlxA-like family protein [Defluviitaleaceae bacterium]|nr:FlxA-like family protein [Defluviitaleaceae bacterium]
MDLSHSNAVSSVNAWGSSQRTARNGIFGENPFDRQIRSLQEQIERLGENESMDSAAKQRMIDKIEEQIEALQEQRHRRQAEEMKRRMEQRREQGSDQSGSSNESSGVNDNGVAYSMPKALVSGSMSISSIRETNARRVSIINEMRIAGEDPTPDPNGSRLQQALYRTIRYMNEQMGEANANVGKYNHEMAEARENENTEEADARVNNSASDENAGNITGEGTKADGSAEKDSTADSIQKTIPATERTKERLVRAYKNTTHRTGL